MIKLNGTRLHTIDLEIVGGFLKNDGQRHDRENDIDFSNLVESTDVLVLV